MNLCLCSRTIDFVCAISITKSLESGPHMISRGEGIWAQPNRISPAPPPSLFPLPRLHGCRSGVDDWEVVAQVGGGVRGPGGGSSAVAFRNALICIPSYFLRTVAHWLMSIPANANEDLVSPRADWSVPHASHNNRPQSVANVIIQKPMAVLSKNILFLKEFF